jgi:tight adherence protein C
MEFILIMIGIFGLVGGSIFLLLAPRAKAEEETIQRRLEAIAASAARTGTKIRLLGTGDESFWENIARFFLGEKELAARYTKDRILLHQAGFPGERGVRIFWGLRIFLTGVFPIAFFLLATLSRAQISQMFLLIAASAGIGYMLPLFYVRRKAKERTLQISETLPDTLDLLVICVEAGLGMDAALVRVGKEQADQGLAFGEELQLMNQEIGAGIARREALSRLAERVGVDDLRGLVTFLVQTEELGGSIARSLRVYSSTMREKRSQKVEEAARKVVIKLIFPLVFFILPAVFLVVMGPAAINIIRVLKQQ